MSQQTEILQMLEQGPVTAIDALKKAGCFRLAARIKELRDSGHDIHTNTIEEGGKHFAQYILKKRKNVQGR